MGTYKGIQGYLVETLSSDPGTISEVQGKLWYNTTSNTWKLGTDSSGAWSTGTVINEGRNIAGGAGTSQTSALIFGGNSSYPYVFPGKTEQYNGSTWTELANQTTARARGSSNGTATSAFWAGGFTWTSGPTVKRTLTEIWNGTSWTEVADLNDAVANSTGMGGPASATAAVTVGGNPEPQAALMEIWNGTSWTEGPSINTPASDSQGCGTTTATLLFAGSPTPRSRYTEEFNGTAWSEKADSSTNRVSGAGSGTSTAAIQMGGYDSLQPPPTNTVNVEVWNGTSWTEVANLAQSATNTMAASITSTSTIKMGGYSGPPDIYYTNSEEWASGPTAATVTTS